MKRRLTSKKINSKISPYKNTLFKKLTDQELTKIKGGAKITGPGEINFTFELDVTFSDI